MSRGIVCPDCGKAMRVLWTKRGPGGIRRQRFCPKCGAKRLTIEHELIAGPAHRIERRLVAAAVWQLIEALALKESIRLEELIGNLGYALTWGVEGIFVQAKLRRTSCSAGVAWSADSMTCRPSLILGLIAGLLKEDRPLLDNLVCDYTPAKGTGEKKIRFVAHRV